MGLVNGMYGMCKWNETDMPNYNKLENYKELSKSNYYLYDYINKHLDLPKKIY